MALLQWQSLKNIADHWMTSVVRLSADSVCFLLACSSVMQFRSLWEQDDGSAVTDSQWDEIQALTAKAYSELMSDVGIGTIFPSALASPPTGALPCDGGTYLRTDWPFLYDLLDPAYITDADHFVTPNLNGRVPIGAGAGAGLSTYAMNDMGGEESHVLITAELASHSHGVTDPGHTHTEGTAVLSPLGTNAGIPSAIPSVGVTGVAVTGISIGNAGSDSAHENRQPYTAVRWCIWAI